MGIDIAKVALAAGDAVVATGRSPEKVAAAVGATDDLLVVKLDVTHPTDAEGAVEAAVERFGRIDVLVNDAGNFYAGFFEEISREDFRARRARGPPGWIATASRTRTQPWTNAARSSGWSHVKV